MTFRRKIPAVLAALAGFVLLFSMAAPASAAPGLGIKKVAKAVQPTSLSSPPGYPRLMFVTGRTGKVWVLRPNGWQKGALLDISKRTDPLMIERGLLGLAFAPDFRKAGRFYIYFTRRDGDAMVEEYRTIPGRPGVLQPGSRRTILRIPRVHELSNHNGGHLEFRGNQLYISVGDGNDPGDLANLAQNPASLRGKILRIDPRKDPVSGRPYRIPAGNPFVGIPGRDEVFAMGLRNPHSFNFSTSSDGTSMMSIYDVGQSRFEELNYLPIAAALGANFGWNDYEGFEPYNCGELCPNGADPLITTGLSWPQLVYSHDDGCAVIGGPAISDPGMPSVRGRIIYGDFCANRVSTAAPDTPTITDVKPAGFFMPPGKDRHPAMNGFGVDGLKRVYVFSNFGEIYRIFQK